MSILPQMPRGDDEAGRGELGWRSRERRGAREEESREGGPSGVRVRGGVLGDTRPVRATKMTCDHSLVFLRNSDLILLRGLSSTTN